jgi:tRNA(Ile)-lysidine synthase TilS/MesJ
MPNEVKIDQSRKIVLGISGGGDSNTLVKSFVESGIVKKDQLIAVMMMGIPDWDLGKGRAEEICKSYGIEFRMIDSKTINLLLGKKAERDWVKDFEESFPDADLEVLGTHCIKLALQKVAKEQHAQAIVTGLNLEDILAECFLSLSKGVLPPHFPIRIIDGFEFWHPLYKIPKKIIDGCFPKYSFQNYSERFPSKMKGRAIPYYLSQSMHTLIPGIEFDLLEGFKKLSKQNLIHGFHDNELGFMTVERVDDDLKSKWKNFIEL